MAKYYIAYGSNINLSQMSYRCPNARLVGAKIMTNWRLTFRRHNAGYANIEKDTGSKVPILIWEITEKCEKALDRYEGVPTFYVKKNLRLLIDGKKIKALVYVMNGNYANEVYPPRRGYFERIRLGYERNNIKLDCLYKALDETIKEFYYIPDTPPEIVI